MIECPIKVALGREPVRLVEKCLQIDGGHLITKESQVGMVHRATMTA